MARDDWRRPGSAGPTTRGITSPAFSMITGSPGRMSLRMMSSGLCSVAIEMVDPATTVGSSIANGVAAPVRPMLISMRCSIAIFRSAGNLNAVAQRGNFEVYPSFSRRAGSFSLITTPSVSNASEPRLSRHSSQNSITASMPSHFFQCGSTGRPHLARSFSISACDSSCSGWSSPGPRADTSTPRGHVSRQARDRDCASCPPPYYVDSRKAARPLPPAPC